MTGPILITGANGFLGCWIAHTATKGGLNIIGTTRKSFSDLPFKTIVTDFSHVDGFYFLIEKLRPSVIIHCAAESNTSFCENNPEIAWTSNVLSTQIIAENAARLQIPIVFISTDLVFDGLTPPYNEQSTPNPISVYSKTKLEAEQWLQNFYPSSWIFRVSLLLGKSLSGKNGYTDNLINELSSGKQVIAFSDEFRSAISAETISKIILSSVLENIPFGLYHIGSDTAISRFEIANQLAKIFQLSTKNILSGNIRDFNGTPPRQPNVQLLSNKIKSALSISHISGVESVSTFAPFEKPFSFSLPILN